MTDDAMIRPIETIYRGYRFRSRTEARWAVFLDAAGIEWKYELQGFNVRGRNYLPDFWLPRLELFVEVKPDIEACKAAEPLMHALVLATGHPGLLIAGAPNSEELPEMFFIYKQSTMRGDRTLVARVTWSQCGACNHVCISTSCIGKRRHCLPIISIINHSVGGPRVDHAMEQAQQARFEHGEEGRPEPYLADDSIVDVYVAGAVLGEERLVKQNLPVTPRWQK
jgi:hypothetical protein